MSNTRRFFIPPVNFGLQAPTTRPAPRERRLRTADFHEEIINISIIHQPLWVNLFIPNCSVSENSPTQAMAEVCTSSPLRFRRGFFFFFHRFWETAAKESSFLVSAAPKCSEFSSGRSCGVTTCILFKLHPPTRFFNRSRQLETGLNLNQSNLNICYHLACSPAVSMRASMLLGYGTYVGAQGSEDGTLTRSQTPSFTPNVHRLRTWRPSPEIRASKLDMKNEC